MPLVHHVVGRGADGARLFADDRDRSEYLERLGVVAERHGWRLLPTA
jgi:hypothetical protein